MNVGDHLKEAQRNQRMFEAMETLTSQFHATEPRISGRFMTDHVPIDNFGVHPFMEPPARQINNQHTMMALFLGFECWFGENRHQQLDVSTFWYFCNALDLDMKRNQKDAMGSI